MPHVGPFLYVLGGVLICGRAGESTLKATFEPGKLGIGATWSTGVVTRVDKGGQGHQNGVELEMVMQKIDGQPYSEKLLDKKIAGHEDYEITFKKPPRKPKAKAPPPKKDEDDVPVRPSFRYAMELDHKSFKEKIEKVTNTSDPSKTPPYYPVVMFHVSWCSHCRHSLPEYEKAAEMVEGARKSGHLAQFRAPPKFFLIECDKPAEHKILCDKHVGSNFPVIKLFRDHRAIHFNRPRLAQTFGWWATHVARPPITQAVTKDDLKQLQDPGPVFILNADLTKHAQIMNDWTDVALDNIEDHTFAFAPPDSPAAKALPAAPSVNVRGQGLEPLPLDVFGDFNRDAITRWVNFNQFKPVAELSVYTDTALKNSNVVVITLVYRGEKKYRNQDSSSDGLAQFQFKANQLRKDGHYLFAEIDLNKDENAEYLASAFPLLDPKVSPPPRIFAFSGKDTYWEDPAFRDPAAITTQSIEALLASDEARQDGSTSAWIKEKRKHYIRFAAGSYAGLAAAIGAPVMMIGCCWVCLKALCAGEDEPEVTRSKGKED